MKILGMIGLYPDFVRPQEYPRFIVEEPKKYIDIAREAKITPQ